MQFPDADVFALTVIGYVGVGISLFAMTITVFVFLFFK